MNEEQKYAISTEHIRVTGHIRETLATIDKLKAQLKKEKEQLKEQQQWLDQLQQGFKLDDDGFIKVDETKKESE